MDSFDVERLQAYRHKVFQGIKLSDDQNIDFADLKKRHADESARKILKEEREELRKQAEEDRKAQRELYQQQRELLLLSRRITPLNLSQVQDYQHLPRFIPSSKSLSLSDSIPSTATSSFKSTASLSSTLESLKLSPCHDDRQEICPSPSLTKGLNRIPSVGDLYASPNRTPTAAARAQTLALQKSQQDQAALQAKLDEEYYKQKLEQRRAATLQRNLATHFEKIKNGDNDKRIKCKHLQASLLTKNESENDVASSGINEEHPKAILESVATDPKEIESKGNYLCPHQIMNHPQYHLHHAPLKPYDHQPDPSRNITNQQQEDHPKESVVSARQLSSRSKQPLSADAVYIETFDVMLCDVKGPLGQRSGGLRRYFKKLLENFVSTGCIYRSVNKIGICVHGTVDVLDMVKRVLDHAMNKTLSPLPTSNASRRGETGRAGRGELVPVSWKYRSTGRTLRHGTWGRHFATRLCENAQRGKYSPRGAHEKAEAASE